MFDFVKQYEYIVFYHTFRLTHDNENYLRMVTKYKNARNVTSNKIRANASNLQHQLKKYFK